MSFGGNDTVTTPSTKVESAVPVYLSFTTLRSAVQSLRAHGLPDKLDRTAWQSRSGGEQSQIISAFKFLGLIDENERTQPSLRKLADAAENSNEEKLLLKEVLRTRYSKVFALNLKTVTQGALSEAIGSYGPTGATRDRAVRFFIKTAQYCGIELSSRLTSHLRSRSQSTVRREDTRATSTTAGRDRPRRRRGPPNDEVLEQQSAKLSGNAVKTITLRNAMGQLTLSGTFNPFELEEDERKLVYDIIDLMKAYEQKEPSSE